MGLTFKFEGVSKDGQQATLLVCRQTPKNPCSESNLQNIDIAMSCGLDESSRASLSPAGQLYFL